MACPKRHDMATVVVMFTGLVQAVGRVVSAQEEPSGGMSLRIQAPAFTACPVRGDSIAVNGCCLTVTRFEQASDGAFLMGFDLVQQTVDMTTLSACQENDQVNLECAATPSTLLGGHIVQGHVDGVGAVRSVQKTPGDVRLSIEVAGDLAELIVPQGSITVAGVSLTVADVSETVFQVALIPATLEGTNLGLLKEGDPVNIETDILLRSMRHLLAARGLLGDADADI
ncbi:MAG: riboflavin synthase [Phycisphaerales bacterium]|nr:riboflavin synthase [Phycisphaerales bacterium]